MEPVLSTSRLDAKLLATLEKAFARHAGGATTIGAADLQRALGLRSEYLARRVFAQFDRNGDGAIARDEFLSGVRRLIFGSDREKLEFAFRLWDENDDGSIDAGECFRMIAMALADADVEARGIRAAERLSEAFMTAADTDRDGLVSFAEFERVLGTRPEILRAMTRSEALWIAPNEDLVARLDAGVAGQGDRRVAWFFQNRWIPVLLLALWGAANLAIFLFAMLRGRAGADTDDVMQASRAAAKCIAFNGALILLPMMRKLLTRVRASRAGRYLPVDDAIDFHRYAGHALALFSIVHIATAIEARAFGHGTSLLASWLTTSWRGLTGTLLTLVFAAMWFGALGFVRRSQRFEVFYFTHLLYLAWFALAIVHAPSFLAWSLVPLVGFAIEQIARNRQRASATIATVVEPLRSGVTRLEIERPAGFRFEAGDYLWLRIPSIARHEWHPFTISSPPERDALAVHVRSLGNWTAALRKFAEARDASHATEPVTVHVDGPYGSPSAHLFRARYAVFIGAGIGVTPFASLLESAVLRTRAGEPLALQKVHFLWLNRDQYSFEWFAEMLAGIEYEDARHLVDMQLFMTGGRAGAVSLGLEVAREIAHSAGLPDAVTGLHAKTHFGHPDWNTVLGDIAAQHPGETVDVFFCGPLGLARKVRAACATRGMPFHQEQF